MPFVSRTYLEFCNTTPERHKEYIALTFDHLNLGWHPETGDSLLTPEEDRYAGMYCLGVQGQGKSGFLENLIHQDAEKAKAVIVIDPHGDLIRNVIAALPPYRLEQTYLLDMEDEAYPFGANLFSHARLDTSVAQAQAVDRIMHVFDVLWPDVLEQAHLPRYLRAATIALLAHPGATLLDMQEFLLDGAMRTRLLKAVTDPTVRQFWRTQYDDLSENERGKRVQPLITRLEQLFMGRSLVRNIIGQRRTTINFRRAIENHEIILIRLPVKTVAQDARLIGMVLMTRIHAAVFSFGDLPTEQRPSVALYVDEVQHFATQDFTELFTEGRKFGVKVTIAHQFRNQLPEFLRDSTMTARTKVCFQTTPEDGRAMAHFFPAQATEIKPEDMDPHPIGHLLDYGSGEDNTQLFTDYYLRPLQGRKRGNRVEISDMGFSLTGLAVGISSGGEVDTHTTRVPDPTPYLDSLLYQVMKSHDHTLLIPPEAVIGFSECGDKGFYQNARRYNQQQATMQLTDFPDHMVQVNGENVRWIGRISDGNAQLHHFLFHLRIVMFILANDPIGKVSEASTADIGKMLPALPQRAAFVRSGDDVGVIFTNDTPQRVYDIELGPRRAAIRDQTRAKYCHPRGDIERGFMDDDQGSGPGPDQPDNPDAPYTGWEEV